MRRLMTGVVVTLLLAGCDSSADPDPGESMSPSPSPLPSASSVQRATKAELQAVCDTLGRTVTLPGDGSVQYVARFNPHYGADMRLCDIEPDGEYYDVAAKVPVFGRARFNYGRFTDEEMKKARYLRYTPERAEDLLRVDVADPLKHEVPCANKPCKNGINGYIYEFRFEAVLGDNITVEARFDYITTDVKGDKKPQYRALAIKEFKASMEVIAAELT